MAKIYRNFPEHYGILSENRIKRGILDALYYPLQARVGMGMKKRMQYDFSG